jgi:hypothetical protein
MGANPMKKYRLQFDPSPVLAVWLHASGLALHGVGVIPFSSHEVRRGAGKGERPR